MDFNDFVLQEVQKGLAQTQANAPQKLYRALRMLAKARSQLIHQQLIAWNGTMVRKGPFWSMNLNVPVTEGCSAPKLLGCYEEELHGVIQQLPQRGYQRILDIGCAEGYYAVGLARMIPHAKVYAFDNNPQAQATCQQLAVNNQVANRLQVGGDFTPEMFQQFRGARTLLVCDIEGAELQLLDPQLAPALAEFDILVELHDVFQPNLSQQVLARFQASHEIEVIPFHGYRDIRAYPELEQLEHLDRLLAIWEWRSGATPWAWLRAKITR
jgi:SAM-dependent methyltransferase